MDAKNKIIVALDTNTLGATESLIGQLAPYVGCFKVGLEFIYSLLLGSVLTANEGVAIGNLISIRRIFNLLDGKIFLDGKLSDIPNTVGGAARAVARLNVVMFNVHASAGIEAMKAAVADKGQSRVLAVTVLTSLNAKDIWNLGYVRGWQAESWECYPDTTKERYIPNLVLEMALRAKEAGVDGIICSPQELEFLGKNNELTNLLKVTPGIRPEWAEAGDQKRFMTPKEAIQKGADYLVIGRPITQPPSFIGTPTDAAKLILNEINSVL